MLTEECLVEWGQHFFRWGRGHLPYFLGLSILPNYRCVWVGRGLSPFETPERRGLAASDGQDGHQTRATSQESSAVGVG